MHALLAVLALVLLLPHPAAETFHGCGEVTDGDTLRVGGIAVRLKGIIAPGMDEPGRPEAKAHLAALVKGRVP